MAKEFKIASKPIGRNHPLLVIAEMSGNHNQSLDRALEIVEAASNTGAHALKIQIYTPDTTTLDLDEREFQISDPKSTWVLIQALRRSLHPMGMPQAYFLPGERTWDYCFQFTFS